MWCMVVCGLKFKFIKNKILIRLLPGRSVSVITSCAYLCTHLVRLHKRVWVGLRWFHGFYSGSTACKAFRSDRLPGSELCFPRGPRLSPANPPRQSRTRRFVVITWQGAGSAGPGRRGKRQKVWRTEQNWADGAETCPQICLGRGGGGMERRFPAP